MKFKNFFCQFPNPWTLRVSGMGGYTSNCEKKSKSLDPIVQCTRTQGYSICRLVIRTIHIVGNVCIVDENGRIVRFYGWFNNSLHRHQRKEISTLEYIQYKGTF
jgi:hypothetical protein